MTERQQIIVQALLHTLKQINGGQIVDPVLHASVNLKCSPPRPSLAEFEEALELCDANGWIISIPSSVTGNFKRSLSDKGRAALKEL